MTSMNREQRIKELEQLIRYHREKYYNGIPEISDEEFDKLEDELRNLDPDNPVLKEVGALPKRKKINTPTFLGSLEKVSKESFVDFLKKQLKQYKIPTLDEVLDLVKKANKEIKIKERIVEKIKESMGEKQKKSKKRKVWLLVEIKEPGCEEKLAESIKKKGMIKNVIVVSFFDEPLKKIKQLINVKTGFIFSLMDQDVALQKAIEAKASFIIPRYDVITKDLVKVAHKHKFKVIAWTVDDVKIAKQLIKMHVDGIASNKPDLLSKNF